MSVTHSTLIKAIGQKAYAESTVKEWMRLIKNGRIDVSEGRGGDRSDHLQKDERIEKVRQAMDESRHWSLRSLSSRLSIPRATVQRIVKRELGLTKKLGKWVPHELTDIQKEHRVLACKMNLADHSKDKTLLTRTIAIDETWVSLYMAPDRSQQRVWLASDEELPEVPCENIHGNKRMLILGMDYEGIAVWKLLPEKTTVDGQVYLNFLMKDIGEWLGRKTFKKPVLLHDNARPHKARIVQDFLTHMRVVTWYHPPYSPDISPPDFNCFGPLKRKLRGVRYSDWAEFEAALKRAVEELNQQQAMRGARELPDRWHRVIPEKEALRQNPY